MRTDIIFQRDTEGTTDRIWGFTHLEWFATTKPSTPRGRQDCPASMIAFCVCHYRTSSYRLDATSVSSTQTTGSRQSSIASRSNSFLLRYFSVMERSPSVE